MSYTLRNRRPEDGFTLVELLVVIVILGILIAIAVPTFLGQQDKANDAAVLVALNTAYENAASNTPDNGGNFTDATSEATAISDAEPELRPVTTATDESGVSNVGALYVIGTGGTPGTEADTGNFEVAGLSKSGHLCILKVTGHVLTPPSCSDSGSPSQGGTGGTGGSGNNGGSGSTSGDIADVSWTQQNPPTGISYGRYLSSMAYDAATGQMVLFGGNKGSISPSDTNETYTWNGVGWAQQNPVTSPAARQRASMAYDAATGQVVLFGGTSGTGMNDTWTWDGTNWTKQTPATSPTNRYGSAMAYDAATGQIVLFGGRGVTDYSETWTWDGTNWTKQTPATSPPARYLASMAYDGYVGQVVLFGGQNDTTSRLGDTWAWDGTNWKQLSITAPGPRIGAAMDYDPGTHSLVLYGGYGSQYQSDTWNFGP